jgi:hypothetical protein
MNTPGSSGDFHQSKLIVAVIKDEGFESAGNPFTGGIPATPVTGQLRVADP